MIFHWKRGYWALDAEVIKTESNRMYKKEKQG